MTAKFGTRIGKGLATGLALLGATGIGWLASAQPGPQHPGPGAPTAAPAASGAPAEGPSAAPTATGEPGAAGGASDLKSKCVASFESYQDLRQAGALVQAQKETLFCSQADCPDVIKAKCGEWVRELKTLVPSVVFTAVDADGKPLTDVSVQLDGKVVATGLDGHPQLLDPGPHHLHYERAGSGPVDQDIQVRTGEQNRKLVAKFLTGTAAKGATTACPAASGASAESSSGGISPVAWIGFGVAGTGLIIGAVAGILELTNVSTIKDACETQGCTQEQIDNTASVADVATASFIVAGVGLVTGIIAAVVSGGSSEEEPAAKGTSAAVSVRPLLGPGFAGVQGRF